MTKMVKGNIIMIRMMDYLIKLIGIAGSFASLAPHLERLKNQFSDVGIHEKVITNCYKKAIKDITGVDISKFRLKGEIAIFCDAIDYFEVNNFEKGDSKICELLGFSVEDLIAIDERFKYYLKDSGNPSAIIHLLIEHNDAIRKLDRKISNKNGLNVGVEKLKKIFGIKTHGYGEAFKNLNYSKNNVPSLIEQIRKVLKFRDIYPGTINFDIELPLKIRNSEKDRYTFRFYRPGEDEVAKEDFILIPAKLNNLRNKKSINGWFYKSQFEPYRENPTLEFVGPEIDIKNYDECELCINGRELKRIMNKIVIE